MYVNCDEMSVLRGSQLIASMIYMTVLIIFLALGDGVGASSASESGGWPHSHTRSSFSAIQQI